MSDRPPLLLRRLRALWRRLVPARGVEGFVDGYVAGEIRGWAIDPERSNRRVHVIAVSEGKVVAEALADISRTDLVQDGRGDGRHAFRLRLPAALLDGEPRTVEVRAVAAGASTRLMQGRVAVGPPPGEQAAGGRAPRQAVIGAAGLEDAPPRVILAVWPGGSDGVAGWSGDVIRLGDAVVLADLADAHTVIFARPGDHIAAQTPGILTRSRPLADVVTWDGADAASRRPEARALGVRLGESLDGRFAVRGHVFTLAGEPLLQALRAGDARAAELCLAARPELRWTHLPARLTSGPDVHRDLAATPPGPVPDRLTLAVWPGWSDAAAASMQALLEQAPKTPGLQVLVAAAGAGDARAFLAALGPDAASMSVQAVDPPAEDTPVGWLAAMAAAASGEVAVICQAGVVLAGGLEEVAAWAASPGVGAVTVPIGGARPLAGLALKRTGDGWTAISAFSPELEGRSRPVLAAPAAFLAIGRERLAMLGGPADGRLPAGGAHLDLGLRLRRLGLACVLLGHLRAEARADERPAGELAGAALAAFDPAELAAAADAYPAP